MANPLGSIVVPAIRRKLYGLYWLFCNQYIAADAALMTGTRSMSAFTAIIIVVGITLGGLVMGLPPLFIAILAAAFVVLGFVTLELRTLKSTRATAAATWPVLVHFGLVGVGLFGLIQLVPYGRDHTNPVVTGEPAWSSPRTRELMVGACYGCHSNEVEYPWYANVAPVSWAISDHVSEGRDEVNYSEFTSDRGEADETIEVILDGSMPPRYYTAFGLHPEASLSDSEIAELVAGLRATPGLAGESDEDERDERDERGEQDEVDEPDEDDEH